LVKDCVSAALAQTYQNFEVLVSNNASTDETERILNSFSDRRLRVITQTTNIGLFPNWNACLAKAKGDYIVLVPDDDRIAPWLLERCIAQIRKEPEVPVVVSLNDTFLLGEGLALPAVASRRLRTGIYDGVDILEEYLRDEISIAMCTIVFRTRTLLSIGGFPIGFPYAGDMATWAPILVAGTAGFVNECCGTFSFHLDAQSSRLTADTRLRDVRKVVDLIVNIADISIENPQKRRAIKLAAKRYFAHCAVQIVASARKGGVKLVEILPVAWRYRGDLVYIRNWLGLVRSLAILFLPKLFVSWLSWVKKRGRLLAAVERHSF
jgi:glycosyltransferase involved in cell wall biosynthesis